MENIYTCQAEKAERCRINISSKEEEKKLKKYQHHDSSNCKKDAGPWPIKICQCNNKEWMIDLLFSTTV